MCNEEGGVVDDLIVYKVRDNCYFIVVNAANKDKDYAWMKAHQSGDVVFEDISDSVAQLALQGPKAWMSLKRWRKRKKSRISIIPAVRLHDWGCAVYYLQDGIYRRRRGGDLHGA